MHKDMDIIKIFWHCMRMWICSAPCDCSLFQDSKFLYSAGPNVRVECRSKATGTKTCSFDGTTDHTGTYNILVADEHEHEICESYAH